MPQLQPAKIFNKSVSYSFARLVGQDVQIGTPVVRVLAQDRAGNVSAASGATLPTDGDAGYAKGCTFVKTGGGVGSTIYVNEGSETSADFNPSSSSADSAGLSGLFNQKYALMVWDFAVDGGTIGNIVPSTAPTIPDNAVVTLDSYDVLTTVTTAGGDAGTIKIDFATDGDVSTAIAVSDASNPWDQGVFSRIAGGLANPKTVKLTAARQPRVVVATQNVTAGKIVFCLKYWVSA